MIRHPQSASPLPSNAHHLGSKNHIATANAGVELSLMHMNSPMPTTDDPRSPANIARRRELKLAERDELGRLLPGSVLERAGRPEGPTVMTLARQHTHAAVTVLREIVDDAKAPPAARATAAQALLDRGWGKVLPPTEKLTHLESLCRLKTDPGVLLALPKYWAGKKQGDHYGNVGKNSTNAHARQGVVA